MPLLDMKMFKGTKPKVGDIVSAEVKDIKKEGDAEMVELDYDTLKVEPKKEKKEPIETKDAEVPSAMPVRFGWGAPKGPKATPLPSEE